MPHFLHIAIVPKPGVSEEQVQKVMDSAKDWIEYGTGLYVVYTTSDVTKWKGRLIDLVKTGGTLFICRLEVAERQGWMPRTFWQWIADKHGGKGSMLPQVR